MKKILAVLSGAAMLFVSCVGGEGVDTTPAVFPDAVSVEAEIGGSYELTFTASHNYQISLDAESQRYAILNYEGEPGYDFYGQAGEHTYTVKIKPNLAPSYAKDLKVNVNLTMKNETKLLALYTIPRAPYEINLFGRVNPGFEESCKSVCNAESHPADSPFAYCGNKYTVTHYSTNDALDGNMIIWHDYPRANFNYVIYVKDASGNFVSVGDGDSESEVKSWVEMVAFTGKDTSSTSTDKNKVWQKFRLYMNVNSKSAVKTEGVGYEAYVNMEDENGDAVVSVYHVFDPDKEVVAETFFGLANPELAAEKGVKLEGEGKYLTLTLPTLDLITENFAAATLKIEGYYEVYPSIAQEKILDVVYNEENGTIYIALKEGSDVEQLLRNDTLTVSAVGDTAEEYSVAVVFEWSTKEEELDEIPDEGESKR